jgi:hypothetical protein
MKLSFLSITQNVNELLIQHNPHYCNFCLGIMTGIQNISHLFDGATLHHLWGTIMLMY